MTKKQTDVARRNKAGVLYARVELARVSPRVWRASTLSTPAVQYLSDQTPKKAVEGLVLKLGEPVVPYGKSSQQLLSAPWKAPGKNQGGPPVKREEPATESFSMRLGGRAKVRLTQYAAALRVSPAQLVLDALEAYYKSLGSLHRAALTSRAAEKRTTGRCGDCGGSLTFVAGPRLSATVCPSCDPDAYERVAGSTQ